MEPTMTAGKFLKKRSKPFIYISWIFGISVVLFCGSTWGFEVNTHKQLTDKAIDAVEFNLNGYLTENVGLEGGVYESVSGMTGRQWIVEGSEFEDEGRRPRSHFHDPVYQDGLGGIFDSVIDWSLQPVGMQKWSWNDAREYYFKAITSPMKAERDENWSKTFRALGQVMHLIQDMASPAHVRNDPHLSFAGNGDTDGLHDFMEVRDVATYLGFGIFGPDPSMLEQPGALRSEPFSNLFDYNQYVGINPEVTLGEQVGLAEYANANFFSDDRIPGQANIISVLSPFFRLYDYPSLAELIPAPSSSSYLTLSRLGSPPFPHARVAKYTGNQALAKFNLGHLNYDLIGNLQLDDVVYDAYATHLIPRAVGYSAAVLDYFFRGNPQVQQSEFLVIGQILPGRVCSMMPQFESGSLSVDIEIPPGLNFDGTITYYYERPGGERIKIQEGSGGSIPLNHIPQLTPVRWYAVLEGPMGPGVQEERAILAKTGKASWKFVCDH